MLVLAAGLTDIISRMPTPPGKMKKTNHYVQWQQLKQLHKATYVGSYKPLVSRVGLCVSTELWTFLTEPSLAETSTADLKLSPNRHKQMKGPDTIGSMWTRHRLMGLCPCQRLSVCLYVYFLNLHLCLVCVFKHVFVCVFFARGSISMVC